MSPIQAICDYAVLRFLPQPDRVKKLVFQARNPMTGRRDFQELVRPRQSVFRFGEIRTISCTNPERVSDELFERYVMRSSAGKHMAS